MSGVNPDGMMAGPAGAVAAGPRVLLRPLTLDDEPAFTRLVRASAGLLHPWMELPGTPEEFRQTYARRIGDPACASLLVRGRGDDAILGLININNIVRGRFQCGSLGYCAFAPGAGRGYLAEGLELVIGYAFGELRLHRLEANIQPANHRSIRLAERLGFRREGYSPGLLFIDGAWRDHERWALTAEMRTADRDPARGPDAGRPASPGRGGPGPGSCAG